MTHRCDQRRLHCLSQLLHPGLRWPCACRSTVVGCAGCKPDVSSIELAVAGRYAGRSRRARRQQRFAVRSDTTLPAPLRGSFCPLRGAHGLAPRAFLPTTARLAQRPPAALVGWWWPRQWRAATAAGRLSPAAGRAREGSWCVLRPLLCALLSWRGKWAAVAHNRQSCWQQALRALHCFWLPEWPSAGWHARC